MSEEALLGRTLSRDATGRMRFARQQLREISLEPDIPHPNTLQETFYWCTVTPIQSSGWPRQIPRPSVFMRLFT